MGLLNIVPAALVALAVVAPPRVALAEIYKCKGADGRILYSDAPCAVQAQQETVRIDGAASAPAAANEADKPTAGAVAGAGKAPPTDCRNWGPPRRTVRVDQPPPEPDLSSYPRDSRGRPILGRSANLNLLQRQSRDLLTVIAACQSMIADCFHRDGDMQNSFDACFNSAPRCRTARPWEEEKACCPESCWQGYGDQRRQCVDPLTASLKVFNDQHCSVATGRAQKR